LFRAVARPADIAPTAAPADTGEPWFAIVNPMAGRSRRNARAWHTMQAALREAGVRFDVAVTTGPGDGARLAAAARAEGRRRFLVAGGDGSAHDVVNGLMQARQESGSMPGVPAQDLPTLVPLPLGTGNDWARSLRLPGSPARLAQIIRQGRAVPHDVGRIDFPLAGPASPASCWFINVAGAGFDAHVIERMPAQTPSGPAYLLGALRELGRYRAPYFTIDAGRRGHVPVTGRMLLAFVANGRYCGGHMLVAPKARQDDGEFDVVTIDDVGLLRALPRLLKLYTGRLQGDPLVRHQLTTSVLIDSLPRAGVEADGQFVGHTPARFTVCAGSLQVLRGD
jgi:YegS/Rv2252/BmrU family lipid kinase